MLVLCSHCNRYNDDVFLMSLCRFFRWCELGLMDISALSNLSKYQSRGETGRCDLYVRYQSYCSSEESVLRLCFFSFFFLQALLNLGTSDPSLRLAAYNLLCSVTKSFNLKIEERLLEGTGLFLVWIYLKGA